MAAKRLSSVISVAIVTIGCCYAARVAKDWWRLRREVKEDRRRDWAAKKIAAIMRRHLAHQTFRRRRAMLSRVSEPLLEAERLTISRKPAVTGLSGWFDGVYLAIDDDGNCFGTSWLVASLLWAVQDPWRIAMVVSSLGSARDAGAFTELNGQLKGIANQGQLFVESLAGWWEGHPSPDPTFGVALAARLVRILHAARDLTAKRSIAVIARSLDVWYAAIELEKLSLWRVLDNLRTIGNAVDPLIGIHSSIGRGFGIQPGGGLGLLLEMRTEYVTPEATRRPMEVTQAFRRQAWAMGDRIAHGIKVLHMGAVPHYNILVARGTLLERALIQEFKIAPFDVTTAIDTMKAGVDSRKVTSKQEVVTIIGGEAELAEQVAAMEAFERRRAQRRA